MVVVLESPDIKKQIAKPEWIIVKPAVKVPVGYTKFKEIKQKKVFKLPEKSKKKMADKAKYNGRVFEELISVKEIRRNIHFRNYGIY